MINEQFQYIEEKQKKEHMVKLSETVHKFKNEEIDDEGIKDCTQA